MERKTILFVIESLNLGGAEKSLVTLLNLLDSNRYEIFLQLFSYGGDFELFLPPCVNILPPLSFFEACKGTLADTFRKAPLRSKFRFLFSRLAYSISLRIKNCSNPEKAVSFWKYCGRCFTRCEQTYDYAIAYAQGVPTYYVADCVNSHGGKYSWVNAIITLRGRKRTFALKKYGSFDKINCVSEAAKSSFAGSFPELSDKCVIIRDINDKKMITRMAELQSDAKSEMIRGDIKILTIGRFSAQKRYDIAVDACKILRDKGLNFIWYAIGEGYLLEDIKRKVQEYSLEDIFVFLGKKTNPYPYIRMADIYVQTSEFEGFGMAIAEARILNVPVVTTDFSAVYQQMKNGENGLVVDINPVSVANGIARLLSDSGLYLHIKEYLKLEKNDDYKELDKLYALIGSGS